MGKDENAIPLLDELEVVSYEDGQSRLKSAVADKKILHTSSSNILTASQICNCTRARESLQVGTWIYSEGGYDP